MVFLDDFSKALQMLGPNNIAKHLCCVTLAIKPMLKSVSKADRLIASFFLSPTKPTCWVLLPLELL